MSNHVRRSSKQQTMETSSNMFAKAEQEMTQGFLEVEITGLSMRRLAVAYAVLLRGAWSYTLGSVRSLLRPNHAL